MTPVQAAGGVVFNRAGDVALVHRPAYDDWTLPKGKLEPGEGPLDGAQREVAEETGLACLLGPALGTVDYADTRGRDKTVHYWAMAATGNELAPTKEIDDACCVPTDEAPGLLTYERDRVVLARAVAALPSGPVPVLLVRHAKAGDRNAWDGPDEARPLTRPGRQQAEALADVLTKRSPTLLVSSPSVRCVQTFQPAALALNLPLQLQDALAEGASAERALPLLETTASFGPAAACTHGDVQQAVVEMLARSGLPLESPLLFAKGSTWELIIESGRVSAARYLAPP